MEFRFDATQQFQLDAIASVVGLLDGQGHIGAPLIPAAGSTVVPNRLDLDDGQLLDNLRTVQEERGLPQDDALACIEQNVELYEGPSDVRFPNFSVEMETGSPREVVIEAQIRFTIEQHFRKQKRIRRRLPDHKARVCELRRAVQPFGSGLLGSGLIDHNQ